MTASHKVFVYGTLKDHVGGYFFGQGVTKDRFHLFDGGFPMAIPVLDEAGGVPIIPVGRIKGQLFEVDDGTLAYLDTYEGYPSFYDRIETTVTVNDTDHTAWMYIGAEGGARNQIASRTPITPADGDIVEWPTHAL